MRGDEAAERAAALRAKPDYVIALRATCGLSGCAAKPGELCVNSVDGRGPRDEPHINRVTRGRLL